MLGYHVISWFFQTKIYNPNSYFNFTNQKFHVNCSRIYKDSDNICMFILHVITIYCINLYAGKHGILLVSFCRTAKLQGHKQTLVMNSKRQTQMCPTYHQINSLKVFARLKIYNKTLKRTQNPVVVKQTSLHSHGGNCKRCKHASICVCVRVCVHLLVMTSESCGQLWSSYKRYSSFSVFLENVPGQGKYSLHLETGEG